MTARTITILALVTAVALVSRRHVASTTDAPMLGRIYAMWDQDETIVRLHDDFRICIDGQCQHVRPTPVHQRVTLPYGLPHVISSYCHPLDVTVGEHAIDIAACNDLGCSPTASSTVTVTSGTHEPPAACANDPDPVTPPRRSTHTAGTD